MYSVLNATIFTFISPHYDMFRPQTAIIRCFVYAKTVALYNMYKMLPYLYTRVEAGSDTSTVTLRVVGGDEKGSLKTETVKYCHESYGTRTQK
jgi:hypothetical protein